MIILKQLNGKAIWLLDTLNQDSIEKNCLECILLHM